MASCFGPITYSPCPLLLFRLSPATQQFELVATGSLSSVDPDRIMLKKVAAVQFTVERISLFLCRSS